MRYLVLILLCSVPAVSFATQTRTAETDIVSDELPQDQSPSARSAGARSATGQTMNVGNGTIGQRQTRYQIASSAQPLDRIEDRIASRVQTRLRTRIDRSYDAQANGLTSFSVASDQVKNAGRARVR